MSSLPPLLKTHIFFLVLLETPLKKIINNIFKLARAQIVEKVEFLLHIVYFGFIEIDCYLLLDKVGHRETYKGCKYYKVHDKLAKDRFIIKLTNLVHNFTEFKRENQTALKRIMGVVSRNLLWFPGMLQCPNIARFLRKLRELEKCHEISILSKLV